MEGRRSTNYSILKKNVFIFVFFSKLVGIALVLTIARGFYWFLISTSLSKILIGEWIGKCIRNEYRLCKLISSNREHITSLVVTGNIQKCISKHFSLKPFQVTSSVCNVAQQNARVEYKEVPHSKKGVAILPTAFIRKTSLSMCEQEFFTAYFFCTQQGTYEFRQFCFTSFLW